MYAGVAGGRTGKSQPVDQGAVTYWHHRRWPRNLFTTVEILSENANFSPPVNFPVIRTVDRANVLSITQQDQ